MNFIEFAAKKLVDTFEPLSPEPFKGLPYPDKCQQALKMFAANAKGAQQLPPVLRLMQAMTELIVPFVFKSEKYTIRSASLLADKKLVDDLAGASLPANVLNSYFQIHDQIDNWFIQLPQRTFLYSDTLWLEGVFYLPGSNVTAIVCRSDTGQYAYGIDHNGRLHTVDHPLAISVAADTMQRARVLAQLAILHYDSKRHQGHDFGEQQRYPDTERVSPKKSGKRNLKYSLFRSINLDYQGDYRTSQDTSRPTTRKPLDHRFSVRGHFRWQAYGKKFSKHKLMWIDSHTRGSGELDSRATQIKL